MPQRIDNVVFDPRAHLISGPTRRVHLEHRLVNLLSVLVAQPGRAVHRHALIADVWADVVVSDDSLTKAVSELRKALRTAGYAGGGIVTIPKQGYLLDANVHEVHSQPENVQPEHVQPENVQLRNAQPRNARPPRFTVLAAGTVIVALLLSGHMPTTVTKTLPGDVPEGTLLRVTEYESTSGARIKLKGVTCDERPRLTEDELRQAMANDRLPEGCRLDY